MTGLSKVCSFPEQMHPVSDHILRQFMDGEISAAVFLQYFSLPNSSYIDLAECIVRVTSA